MKNKLEQGVVVQVCNPRTQEVKVEGSQVRDLVSKQIWKI
jgi:hypothetical protein